MESISNKGPSNDLLPAWKNFFTHLDSIRIWDALLGISSLVFLLLMTVRGHKNTN